MIGPLEDLYNTRTEQNTKGTIVSEWNHSLLWRDLNRLIAEGLVSTIECPTDLEREYVEHHCFRDNVTGETYVYIKGWERGSPEFRRLRK